MKDHEIRELVNQLRDVAIKYHGAGQLREQIARTVRAAMLQAGNSPVIPGAEQRIADAVELLKKAAPAMLADNGGPDGPLAGRLKSPVIPEGYVMVPKEPTSEMVKKMRYHVGGYDRNIKEGYKVMLAAADCSIPMISDRWIPVSERLPTKQDGSVFLTWNGQYIGKELFLMSSFQCLKPEIITHWMPLPAAPEEVRGE
ncbi:DUF551 domain-containing protein [Raoultella ornithinolytica]|uniref:DUF551 domain-containing protein n=1 Tax=Raoultella ornithinolytica TaxID=54291 RepID=UPI00301DA41E